MSDQEEEVAAKVTTVETNEKKPRNPADDEDEEDYEADIVMKGDVRMPKLTNDNYWKWAKSMRMNLLGRRVWKIVNGDVSRPIKPKNRILWMYDDVAAMSYITENLDDEQLKYIIKCETVKEVWNTLKWPIKATLNFVNHHHQTWWQEDDWISYSACLDLSNKPTFTSIDLVLVKWQPIGKNPPTPPRDRAKPTR